MQNQAVASASTPIRVLVADDDPIQRAEIASRLVRLNGQPIEAEDGGTAWAMLAAHGFEAAIVDLNMPNLDGFALIRCIRGYPRTRHVPIIVVSASSDSASVQAAMEAGATSFLVKPIAWTMFEQHIGFLLRLMQRGAVAQEADLAVSGAANSVLPPPRLIAPQINPVQQAPATPMCAADIEPIIDIGKFSAFVHERSVDRVPKTIAIFVAELESKADQMAGLMADRNVESLKMLAHSFIGSGAMLGAARLVKLGRQIEAACSHPQALDWSTAEELLATSRETVAAFARLKSRDALLAAVAPTGKAA